LRKRASANLYQIAARIGGLRMAAATIVHGPLMRFLDINISDAALPPIAPELTP